jgi:hypothetical protein
MNSITRLFIGLLIPFTLVMSSCEGDDGLPGPPGPQGPQGYDGLPGADGVSDITAIQYVVEPGDWLGNIDGYTTELTVAEITSDVFNNSAILVYRIREDENPIYQNLIPYTWIDNSSVEYMDADIRVGSIKILLRWTDDGLNSTEAPTADYVFKVVIAEGNLIASLKNKIDITNYSILQSYLKLPN